MNRKQEFALAAACVLVFSTVAGLNFVSSPLLAQAYYGQYTPGVYIRSDGQIEPSTARIEFVNGIYRLTGDIYTGVGVETSDIVLDGNGYRLVGYSSDSGLLLQNVNNITLRDIKFERFNRGISLVNASNCSIKQCNLGNCSIEVKQNSHSNQIFENTGVGVISIEFSDNNTLNNNNARCISVLWSKNINLSYNHLSSFERSNCSLLLGNYTQGIAIDNSANCQLRGNTIERKGLGIEIWQSTNLTLTDNTLTDNLCGIKLWGDSLQTNLHKIDTTNTINSKPIYFLVNQTGSTVPSNAGWIAAINCKDITIQNWKSTPNWDGILFVNTTNSNIENCDLTDNYNALRLANSSNCYVTKNTLQNSQFAALRLEDTTQCIITENNFVANFGFFDFWHGAQDNTLYHNNFVGNWSGSLLWASSNSWDNVAQGNYWSSFTGVDLNQDGISDIPYRIAVDSNETDQYPLIKPWGSLPLGQNTSPSSLSMPQEYLNYTIYNNEGTLWAKIDGLYPIHYNTQDPNANLPLAYPIPPQTRNIQVKLDGIEVPYSDYSEIDPLAMHYTDLGNWEMISCNINPTHSDFMLEIHYEHPVQIINGSYVFLYDLNISPYLSPSSSSSIAHFQITLEQNFPYLNVYTTGFNGTWQPIPYQNTTNPNQKQTLLFEVTSQYKQPLHGDIAIILSNNPIPEFPPWIILPLLFALTATALLKRRLK